MKRALKTNMLLLSMAIATFMASCESVINSKSSPSETKEEEEIRMEESSSVFPPITEKGVAPFFLDGSFLNIPPRGEYYDNIVLNRYYEVVEGDHVINITEDELDEYYGDFGSFSDVLEFHGTGVVMQGVDTVLIVTYNKEGVISIVEVFSEKLQLENGIHVGLSSEMMASKYDARFLTTDCFAGDPRMCYYVKGLHNNITLLTAENNHIFEDIGGLEPNCGEKIYEYDYTPVYQIPMYRVKEDYLASIVIMKNGWNVFHQL